MTAFSLLARVGSTMSSANLEMALSCPICMEKFSDTRYPIVPNCGHSICWDCGNKPKTNQCSLCRERCFYDHINKTTPWFSKDWNKNYALLDLVKLYAVTAEERNRLKLQYEGAIPFVPNDIDYMECSQCKTMEKRERLQICKTCATNGGKREEEKEIVPFVLCGFCCHQEHNGHLCAKYLPWKLDQLRTSVVTTSLSTVDRMDEQCAYEYEEGKKELKQWNKKIGAFRLKFCSYRNGVEIADSLKREADLVAEVAEHCLPSMKKYRRVVAESMDRLQQVKEKLDVAEEAHLFELYSQELK